MNYNPSHIYLFYANAGNAKELPGTGHSTEFIVSENDNLILAPSVAAPPLASNTLDPNILERCLMKGLLASGLANKLFYNNFLAPIIDKAICQAPFTPLADTTGRPAMSVPLYWGDDSLLFQVADQLEQAQPWKHRIAPLCTH